MNLSPHRRCHLLQSSRAGAEEHGEPESSWGFLLHSNSNPISVHPTFTVLFPLGSVSPSLGLETSPQAVTAVCPTETSEPYSATPISLLMLPSLTPS